MGGAKQAKGDSGAALTVVPPPSATKQVLLDTAKRLFSQQGYDATSLRQIADAVGMTKAAVYYHYPAKEHLLLALTRPMLDGLSELVTQLRTAKATAPVEALAAYLDLFIEHLSIISVMARDPATQNHPDVGQRARVLVESIQRLIAGGDATTERTVRTACAMGVVHAIATLPPDVVRRKRDTILAAAVAALDA
jgi:AcrR family transcriptional regulator